MSMEVGGGDPLSLCNFTYLLLILFFCLFSSSAASIIPNSLPRGIHPLDEKYYGAEVIRCKDGSKSFTKERLNDNFCDCVDGTDEPGTAACPAGKFYCKNLGSTPKFVFSSRVNDNICDCCDGSDEYDGSTRCPNTCIMGGNIVYKPDNYQSGTRKIIKTEDSNEGIDSRDKIQKLKVSGLKLVIALQLTLIGCLVMLCMYSRRAKSKRRRAR